MDDRPSSGTGAPDANVPRGFGAPRDPAPSGSGPTPDGNTTGTTPEGERPPGLREQFGRTRSAALGLVAAHIKLAQAEFSEIIGEIKRAVMLGSVALGLLFVAATIFTVGSVLWLDEWWFGSMGWGVLHGTEIFIAIAILLVLAIVDLSTARVVASLLIAVAVGAVISIVLGLDYRQIGDQNFTNLAAGTRPAVLGVAGGAIILGVFGLLVGAYGGGAKGAIGGLVGGAIFGALLGLLGSAKPGWQVAVAIGVAIGLVLWPILAAIFVFRHGIDTEKLKDRFMPDQTIETTKETIEWVRAQTPLGRKS